LENKERQLPHPKETSLSNKVGKRAATNAMVVLFALKGNVNTPNRCEMSSWSKN